jgi:hypothetical protein
MSTFRRGRWGTRDTAAAGGLEARAAVARLLLLAGTAVALVLVAGIVLVFLDANRANDIVNVVLDAGRWLAGPFDGLFRPSSQKTEIAVNWGIAAVVYFAVSRLIARLILR